jgi:hypothetical protein
MAKRSYGWLSFFREAEVTTAEGSVMAPKQASQSSSESALHHHYHALLSPRKTFTSEQNLMMALLADAVGLAVGSEPADHHAAAQAWDWILGFGHSFISFEDACDAVGLDHRALRNYTRRLRAHRRERERREWRKSH